MFDYNSQSGSRPLASRVFKIPGFAGNGFLPPLFHFLALVHFLHCQNLGLSLLRNQTETLATQATGVVHLNNFAEFLSFRVALDGDAYRLWKH